MDAQFLDGVLAEDLLAVFEQYLRGQVHAREEAAQEGALPQVLDQDRGRGGSPARAVDDEQLPLAVEQVGALRVPLVERRQSTLKADELGAARLAVLVEPV